MHHFPFQNTFRSPHGVRSAFSDAKAGNQSAWSALIRLDFVFSAQIFEQGMRAKISKNIFVSSLRCNIFLSVNLLKFPCKILI
jgi:hypothetical protein